MPYISIITVIIFIVLIFLAIRQNRMLKAKAKQCVVEAAKFHEKLQQLSDPSHLFSDEELHLLKRESTNHC